ncbi:MAG: PCMD domain-containing protein [Bacteroidetes bacterium]|nr:PCMD domain-containing protein [Bacteroidota bacterium]
MKHIEYIILIVLVFFICQTITLAQNDSIPNSGFEVWIDNPFLNYEEPEHWSTPNPYTSVPQFNIVTVEKDSIDPHSGDYSAKLTSKFIASGQMPGIMTLGTITIDLINFTGEIRGGIPFNQQPAFLTGYYKYNPVDGDTCLILARLYRFIPAKGKQDLLALATFRSDVDTSEWAYFSAPFVYYNDTILPDSMNIIILSSANFDDPRVGSRLRIDDLKIEGTLGITEPNKPFVNVIVMPNPARDFVVFELEIAVRNGLLLIFDTYGRKVMSESFTGKKIKAETPFFSSGRYFYQILDNGNSISNGSFIISK